jgi:hypothetical protein
MTSGVALSTLDGSCVFQVVVVAENRLFPQTENKM